MKRGLPPTALKARTGLLTPPGKMDSASLKKSFDCVRFIFHPSLSNNLLHL